MRARILWFLTLLAQRRKVSSLWRYNSAIADVMSLAFAEADPAQMSPGEIEIRLNAVLEGPLSRRDKTLGARLHQFFDFATSDPRLYWPEPILELPRVGHKSRPRAAAISGAQISRALAEARGPMSAATLMGGRGGLRVSDMEAILIRDVEHEPKGVLRIHPTKEGDIKTAAGRRQVPLPLLLTSSELSTWQAMTAARRQDTLNHGAQFLGRGGGLDQDVRFDRNTFAQILSESLGLSPHDLRHGALSNLALALLAPTGSKPVRDFTGWSAARIEAIRAEFTSRDTLGGMHQIARLAGHREAVTTFQTYLHLSDLALGLHIAALKDRRPVAEAARLRVLNALSKFPALPAAPRRKLDRLWVKAQIDRMLMEEEPQALIALIHTMPQHAICFNAAEPAKRWLHGFGRTMQTKMQLHLADQRDAARWAGVEAPTIPAPKSRLILQIATSEGTNAVPLLHYAADVAVRVLAARTANK